MRCMTNYIILIPVSWRQIKYKGKQYTTHIRIGYPILRLAYKEFEYSDHCYHNVDSMLSIWTL
jgi:hypothetical protein